MVEAGQAYDRRWYVLLTVGLGVFLSTMNSSVTTTILPLTEQELGISLVQSEWISLIYFLMLVMFQLPFGQLSDNWGSRRIFLIGFALFNVATIMCALADDYVVLLCGRALLGLGGAMIVAIGPALTSVTFPPELRGRVLGLQSLMSYIGLSLGPVIGGMLAHYWGWSAGFLATLPFGVAGLLLGLWSIPTTRPRERSMPDRAGIALFMLTMLSATLLLNVGIFGSYSEFMLAFLLAVLGIAFWRLIVHESKHRSPLINLHFYRIPNFRYGVMSQMLNYTCFFLTLFLIPFYLDRTFQLSNAQIGMYAAVMPVVMTICAPLAGVLSDRIGPKILTTLGMVFSTTGLVLFGMSAQGLVLQAKEAVIVGLVLAGIGTGLFSTPNNSAILGSVSRSQQGAASGTLATFRSIGMMLGLTVGGSYLNWHMQRYAGQGADSASLFLNAFSAVMWTGAVCGLIGIMCTLAMSNSVKPVPGNN